MCILLGLSELLFEGGLVGGAAREELVRYVQGA